MSARDYPRIVVPPPGPLAQAVVARDAEWTSTCYIKEYPLVVSRGSGVMVEDVDGNRYLDFMAGIAVSSTGYGHPAVVAAVKNAAVRFARGSSSVSAAAWMRTSRISSRCTWPRGMLRRSLWTRFRGKVGTS